MKDYSNFINGFINNYELDKENNQILVYTPLTKKLKLFGKKEEPYRKPLTKENIERFEKRLKNQYNMIIEHRDEILKYNRGRKMLLFKVLCAILTVIQIFLLIVFSPSLTTWISAGLIIATAGIVNLAINKSDNNFKEEINQYIKYMENSEKIEQLAATDENVIKYLDVNTLTKIEENQRFKQQGLIPSAYNIDLMDKMSLKELRNLLTGYRISESLQETQTFRIPNVEEKQNSKKKTLAPENNQKQQH